MANALMFLHIQQDNWVEYEDHEGNPVIVARREYDPDELRHTLNEKGEYEYTVPGTGGVFFSAPVHESEGYCWWYQDPAWADEPVLSGVYHDKQEAFEDAFNTLYNEWDDESRLGTLDEWRTYAEQCGIDARCLTQ